MRYSKFSFDYYVQTKPSESEGYMLNTSVHYSTRQISPVK